MKLLIEKSLLSPEQELKLDNITTDNKKVKYLKSILRNHPNAANLTKAADIYINSLITNGIDDSKNKFIIFMEKINQDLDSGIVYLIKTLIDNKQLDPEETWLYKKDIYQNLNDTPFYIKVFTYASNPKLQQNSSSKITVKDLYDKKGLLPRKKIEDKLNQITVTTSDKNDTKQDNKNNLIAQEIIKKELNNPNLSIKDFREYLLNILKGDINEKTLSQLVTDDETFRVVWKDLAKLLTSKITTALDEKPIDVVNELLIQTLNSNVR